MKNPVLAPRDGRVDRISVRVGEVVTKHQELVSLDAD
jgi:biotin carboxyl carrier protein